MKFGQGIIVLVASAGLVGCGAGATKTVTVTTTVPLVTGTLESDQSIPQQMLNRYLRAVYPPRIKYNQANARASKAIDAMATDTSYAGWDVAAARSRHVAQIARRAADEIAAVIPPASLKRAHAAYTASYRAQGLVYASLASDIRRHAFINWTDYGHRFNATRQAVIRYRLALISYGAANGLELPPWVHTIGGK